MTSERKTTVTLLVCFALSLGAYLALIFVRTDWDPTVLGESLRVDLILAWPVISFFCLQWLLCRVERWPWPRWAPLILVAVVALIGALYLFGVLGSGWDALGGGLLLCWCVAPVIGVCLGWMAGGGHTAKCVAGAGLLVMLAVYVGLKALGSSRWWAFQPLDVPALAALAAGLWLFFKK